MNKNFKHLKPFAIALLAGFIVAKGAGVFLSSDGVDNQEVKNLSVGYHSYNLLQAFGLVSAENGAPDNASYSLESKVTLKGIYRLSSGNGFVTIFDNSVGKSIFLSRGEQYDGYVLQTIRTKEVVFAKDGVSFVIAFAVDEKAKKPNPIAMSTEDMNVFFDGSIYRINKNYALSFVENTNSFLSNVSLKEHQQNGSINGFEVTYIKPDSLFQKIGFRVGDVINSINNEEIKTAEDTMKLPKSLQNNEKINVKLLRNSNKMELNYEVK